MNPRCMWGFFFACIFLYMAIVSSSILEDRLQIDGRRSIIEIHIDHLGNEHQFVYMSSNDYIIDLTSSANRLNNQLHDKELRSNFNEFFSDDNIRDGNMSFEFSTQQEFFVILRERFANAIGIDAIKIGRQLSKLTDLQLKNLFGYNNLQTFNLRNKLNTILSIVQNIRDQVGE